VDTWQPEEPAVPGKLHFFFVSWLILLVMLLMLFIMEVLIMSVPEGIAILQKDNLDIW